MRRDVKMGFGVGGVLLAVIIVAVLVIHRNQNKEQVRLDTTGKAATGVDPGLDVTGPADSAKPADSSPAPGIDVNKQPDRKQAAVPEDKWEALFASATTEPPKSRLDRASSVKPKQPAVADSPSSDQTTQDDAARPTASNSRSADTARTHTIQAGETLSGIAMAAYGDSRQYKAILAANPGLDASKLRPGTVLQLPPLSKAKPAAKTNSESKAAESPSDGKTYTVQKNDSLYAIAHRLYGSGANQEEIYNLNKQLIGNDSTKLKPGMVLKLPAVPTVH